jgi:hypothetical protein
MDMATETAQAPGGESDRKTTRIAILEVDIPTVQAKQAIGAGRPILTVSA